MRAVVWAFVTQSLMAMPRLEQVVLTVVGELLQQ